ncbi:MAG TPA: ABC transporter ATP-binding protein, partial [Anaeromyxobacteraceae bacterium]|nr:ABC transporter ATP-binding protein [Anaeromyxobacteraceae bacterium]
MSLLEIAGLHVEFATHGGVVHAVRGVDLALEPGKTLAIVGESGCGKSVTVQAALGLIPMPPGRITAGSVRFEGRELVGLEPREVNRIRGREIAMIFQDPMTSLNPTMKIGRQITEALRYHDGLSGAAAEARAIELLERVQIPDARARVGRYPFEFSGGMRQRVMIAMAIACNPRVLIADEPTTALDVTVQAQILELLGTLQRERGMAIVLITHDLGVVAEMADDVVVMYAGKIVEQSDAATVFEQPHHPYTKGLLNSIPRLGEKRKRLEVIRGVVPNPLNLPSGCLFKRRCPSAM